MAGQVPRLAASSLLILRSASSPASQRGLQHLAVLREEGELIGYWTRPDSVVAAAAAAATAPGPLADQTKCRVVVERFNLPPLPVGRWEEAAMGGSGQSGPLTGESILVPKI
jgi:hypothetical protein